jgi:hypothetical protein
VTTNQYEGARGGVCPDCKWPSGSKVAKACDCMQGEGRSREAHERALAEARELQRLGVPLTDPRYY